MSDQLETQWLSDLPSGWEQKRADFLCDPYRVTVNPDIFGDDLVAHYSIPQVQETGGPLIEPASDIDSLKLLITGPTLLVSKLNPRKKTICIAEPHPEHPTLASGEFVAIKSEAIDRRYAYYLWCSEKVTDRLSAIVQSATRSHQRVNPADISKLPWKWPPLGTQRQIARFLDEKTARIDGLIAKKRTLLERLAEKRQALITRAVTKGLDPAAPMKPSGVDWLGDIPAHWEVRRIKELGRLIGGAGFPHDFQGEKDLPLVFFKVADLGRVIQSERLSAAENTINYATAKMLGASIIVPGDIAFAKVGAALLLNRFRRVGVECCIDNNMMAFRPNKLISTEFALATLSRINFADVVNPGAVPSVNSGQVGRIEIALPGRDEQDRIVEQLAHRFADIEFAEGRIRDSIEMLAEYRSALITAAVTGKLRQEDVADAPELEEA